jgi:hypothetical protein
MIIFPRLFTASPARQEALKAIDDARERDVRIVAGVD